MDYLKSLVSSTETAESKVNPTRTETPSQRRKRLEMELEASRNPTSLADTLTTYAATAFETVTVGAGYVAENAGCLVKNAQNYFNPDGSVNENSEEAKRRAKQEGEYGGYVRVRKDQKYPQHYDGRRPDDGRRHGPPSVRPQQHVDGGRHPRRPMVDEKQHQRQHRPEGRQPRPHDDGRARHSQRHPQQIPVDRSPPRGQRAPQRMDSPPRVLPDRQVDLPPRQQRSPRRSNEPPRGHRTDSRYEKDQGHAGRRAPVSRGY